MLKTLIMKAAIVAFLGSISFAAFAIADTQRFDVPAGELAAALESLAKQANVDLVYQEAQVKGLRTKGVSGNFSAREAITKLLEGTPLQLRTDEASGAILITTPTLSGPASTSLPIGSRGSAQLAQAEPTNPSPRSGEEGARDSGKVRETESTSESQELPAPNEPGKAIPEVLVRGSKILNMDIPRSRDDAQPYVILDREAIARSGATNIEHFLRQQLPMNLAGNPNSVSNSSLGNISQVNLRGLGTNQTLILVDGHRLAGGNRFGAIDQANLNGIPLAAIERIEILPATASGIYGSSAVGGVLNVILRRDYSGVEIQATYDNTFETDASNRRVDLAAGFTLGDGKTNVMMFGTYEDQDAIQQQERDFARRAVDSINANNPSYFLPPNRSPVGSTPNFRSTNNTPLFGPGTASYGSVPIGYAGGGGLAPLQEMAGRFNFDATDSPGGRQTLVRPTTLESINATVRREINPQMQFFLEAMASNNTFRSHTETLVNNPTIDATAPNNPFGQRITVYGSLALPPFELESTNYSRRFVGGLILKLPLGWQADVDYTWHKTRTWYSSTPDLLAAGTAAIANGTIDVLRDLNAYPVDLSPYVGPSIPNDPMYSTLKDAVVRVAGPLGQLPAGRPIVSAAFGHRDELVDEFALPTSASGALFLPDRSQSTDSAYVEARVPIVSAANRRAGIEELELQVAGRSEWYEVNGVTANIPLGSTTPIVRTTTKSNSVNPTIALRWKPLTDLMVRASYGTGYLPPSVNQILPAQSAVAINILDPRRGGLPAQLPIGSVLLQGNPDLQAEDSESLSGGIVFTPRWAQGLRLSVDYTRIEKDNAIISPPNGTQGVVDNEHLYPERVVRGPNLPSDPQGWAGPLTFVDATVLNVARASLEAYDVQLDYRKDTSSFGAFEFGLIGTWQPHYEIQAFPNLPFVENAGFGAGVPGGSAPFNLKVKASARLVWQFDDWTLGWNTSYYDRYHPYTATASSTTASTIILNQGGSYVPRQIYHDMFASYRLGNTASTFLNNTEIKLGIKNVFDTDPPFDAGNGSIPWTHGYYSYLGDARLASYYLTVRHAF